MFEFNPKRMIALAALAGATLAFSGQPAQSAPPSLDPYAHETPEQRDQRMAWFREAKFGMFIHWGVYAVPAGTYNGEKIPGIGEWIMLRGKIPVSQYKTYANDFNPVKYDPDAWVRLAKQAGMKYIVITSKHHDGFALFDSKVSDWDVVDATPYGKDLLKPLAEACRTHGMKLGFYYSQAQDWTQGGSAARGGHWDPAQPRDMDQYLRDIAVPQVKEILSNYGDIAVLWWDTPRGMNRERADLLIPALRLQPGIVHNNRLGGDYEGDIKTPEQHIPATGLAGDWESCMTMNRTWGFKSYDDNWKSPQTLVHNLIDIASKGGNYLLNVGPTAEGEIPEPSIERLEAIGRWMDVHGQGIYGTTASPCSARDWGRITVKAGDDRSTLYLHVFDWQDGQELRVPVDNPVLGCTVLTDAGRAVTASIESHEIVVRLNGAAPDPIASVIKLDIEGRPARAWTDYLQANAQGDLVLPPDQAVIDQPHTARLRYDKRRGAITRWNDERSGLSWEFYVQTPGRYMVCVETAGDADTVMAAEMDGQAVQAQLPATGDDAYATSTLGPLAFTEPGVYRLRLRPAPGQWTPTMLRAVRLER